jgi:hypothetical protein
MLLSAVVTKDELVSVIESFTPLRITIDERRGRGITLGRPKRLDLVAGQGLRIRGDANITWDVAGVPIPVTLQAWQMLLVPRIATRGRARVLAFEPVVEDLDLRLVPAFLDEKIADVIRSGVAQKRHKLAWDFTRTLSKRLPLPASIGPACLFEIAALDGGVVVTDTDLRLTVRLEARVERRTPVEAKATSSVRRAATR